MAVTHSTPLGQDTNVATSAPGATPPSSSIGRWLLLFAFVGLHVDPPLTVGSGTIPNYLGFPFAAALLVIHARRVNPTAVAGFFSLFFLYLISAIYGAVLKDAGDNGFWAVAQLAYSFVGAYGIYLELTSWSRRDLSRWARIAMLVFLGLAILEVFTPFRLLTDSFSQFYSRQGIQNSVLRDAVLFGGRRPRVFASEPSLAGLDGAMLQIVWVCAARRIDLKLIGSALAIFAASLLVVRSPFAVFPLIVLGSRAVFGLEQQYISWWRNIVFAFTKVTPVLAFTVVLLALSGYSLFSLFNRRVAFSTSGADWSLTVRTYGAVAAGWRVAMEEPVFGMGVNNFERARAIIMQTYASYKVPLSVLYSELYKRYINNALGSSLIYFGFGGFAVYTIIWGRIMKILSPASNALMRWCLFFLIGASAGNIYSPRFVWPVVGLLAALEVVAREIQYEHRAARIEF